MEIIPAERRHAKEISRLMLEDLKDPDPRFPRKMIARFRKHAAEGVLAEFDNKGLLAFVAVDGPVVGFLVGYLRERKAIIHYVQGQLEAKKALLAHCVRVCKEKKLTAIEADTFSFMENFTFFQGEGFRLLRKEQITPELDMLWFGLDLVS